MKDEEINVNIWNIYFELRMKDQIEERSSQLLRNLSSTNCLSCVVTICFIYLHLFILFKFKNI